MVFYWLVYKDAVNISSREVKALKVGNNKIKHIDGDVASLTRKPAMPVKEVHFSGWSMGPRKVDRTDLRDESERLKDETLGQTISRMQTGESLLDALKRGPERKEKDSPKKPHTVKEKIPSDGDNSDGETNPTDSDSCNPQESNINKTPVSTKRRKYYSYVKADPIDLSIQPKRGILKVPTQSESLSTANMTSTSSSEKHIKFDKVAVREYIICLGDNPACSWGPPLSLSWQYKTKAEVLPIDEYQERRVDEWFQREEDYDFCLSRNQRECILDRLGYSIRAQTEVDLENRQIQLQREETIHKLKYSGIQETMETIRGCTNRVKQVFVKRR